MRNSSYCRIVRLAGILAVFVALTMGQAFAAPHSADTNGDYQINLSELLRVIQIYNSNGYHCQPGTEDGYAPDPGDQTCAPHSSDYNPQDWSLSLSELLRAIQLYNSTGYFIQTDTEDGFAPGTGISVPDVAGLTQAAAQTEITSIGLAVGTWTSQPSTTIPAGNVISQDPAAGAHAASGTAIDLVVSAGPPQVLVPNVVGTSQETAQAAITSTGLIVGTVTAQSSETVPVGNVISQNPAAGLVRLAGTAVNLTVSSGPPQVAVPNVVGLAQVSVISFVIIGIIMLVLGNTMIMSARERTREFAVLKTLGFSGGQLVGLIGGESLMVAALGGGIGLVLTFPLVTVFQQVMPKGFFPVFFIEPITIVLAVAAAFIVGVVASIFPIQRTLKTAIVDGLRFVG